MSYNEQITMFRPYVCERALMYVKEVLQNKWIGQGPKVIEFEEKIKDRIKVPFAVAVNNSASAVRLALAIVGINPGDEIITTAQTCTATNHPILEQYATPVFADIQYLTGNIDPRDVERRITGKTRAIIAVHWAGYPCDLDEIHNIAARHKLPVIEDASEALGATYRDKYIGNCSNFTCFSFQAIQQITTGEGGMLCTLNEKFFEDARKRRWFGIDRIRRSANSIGYYDFDVSETGYGYHMTDIAAAIGIANLEEYETVMDRRREIVARYREGLKDVCGITLFESSSDRTSANQLFTVHVDRRDDFCKAMKSRGIQTSIVHMRNDLYSVFGGLRKDLPVLDRFSETNISIPLHNLLSDQQVDYIIKTIKEGW